MIWLTLHMADVSNCGDRDEDLRTCYTVSGCVVMNTYITLLFVSFYYCNLYPHLLLLLFRYHCTHFTNNMAKLPTRQLGKNGPFVPRLGLGCMGLSIWYGATVNSDEDRLKFLDGAHDLGETFWVTSDRCKSTSASFAPPNKYHD